MSAASLGRTEAKGFMVATTQTERMRSEIRDETLAADLRDSLCHDSRVSDLDLVIEVKGRVAHVDGNVPSEGDRALVRTLLRRQSGLYAAWDLLRLPGQELSLLDVGCGGKKQYASALGVDRVPAPGVDVVADLEQPLPFDADTFDHVFAIHVLEHVRDLVSVMADLHRVLRATGMLHVLTPDWRHVNAVADPTHCRLMDVQTFRYFCVPHPGVAPWRPLMVTASSDTVHADLQPLKDGAGPDAEAAARWFD